MEKRKEAGLLNKIVLSEPSRRTLLKGAAIVAGSVLLSPFDHWLAAAREQSKGPVLGGTLRVGETIDITNADPQVSNVIPIIYAYAEGLTSVAASGEVVPFLARSWETSDDGRTYTFRLHEGVTFHNGRLMTAEDVRWSLERIKNPGTGAFRGADLADVTVEVLDLATVRLTASEANVALPALLSSSFILAPESVGEDGSVQTPISTGPFTFDLWVPARELSLVKYDAYWRRALPYFDAIQYLPLVDPTVLLSALRSDTVDIAASISPTDLPLIERDSTITTQRLVSTRNHYLAFNTRNPVPPLDNVQVRQAIALALDKATMRDVMLADPALGEPTNQMYSNTEFWHIPVADRFGGPDLEEARRLLEEIGIGDFTTNIVTWSDKRVVAEVLQGQLAQLGITLQIDNQPDFASYLARLEQFDWGMNNDAAYPREDPAALFSFFVSQNATNVYRGGYGNPRVDALIQQALGATDIAERKRLYAEALEIIQYEDIGVLFLFSQRGVWGLQERVQGFEVGTGVLNRADGGVAETWLAP